MMGEYDEALDELCSNLGLERHGQDWTIIVSDPNRVDEFVQFFREHPDLSPCAKRLLFELVISSTSDALDDGVPYADLGSAANLVKQFGSTYGGAVNYWVNLGDDWPIARWLNCVMGDAIPNNEIDNQAT